MLYKRSSKPGAHWWVRFQVKGREVRQSSGTSDKALAEAFEQKVRDGIWNAENLGIEVHRWEEACERWLCERSSKRSIERDRLAFRGFATPLNGTSLQDVDRGKLAGLGISARDRAVVRSVLNAAVTWGWLDRAPKVGMPHVEKHDPRWITKEQFRKLCKELPRHAAQLARFAVATGLRRGNIYRLRWSRVDAARRRLRVDSPDAKGRKAIGIPLNLDALAVLKSQSGIHPEFVFADDEGHAPIGSIKTCWGKAVKRAQLQGFRFHDLRHTWAAWHVLAGTPPMILKELGGWSSLAMVEKYGHINPGHLADWADNSRTKVGTSRKRQKRKRPK